jgi:ubiquinone/menaquinone biosynthesis C-methylase UbiE
MDPKEIVANGYNKIAQKYHNWDNHDYKNTNRLKYIQKICKMINKYEILDIGCGSAIWTKELFNITESNNITGIDISEVQIQMAKEIFPQAKQLICEDIMKINFKNKIFNAIIALFSIMHLPKNDQLKIFDKLYSWLEKDGLLLISLNPDIDNEPINTKWMGVDMYWNNIGENEYKKIITNAGFEIIECNILNEKTKNNDIKILWIICKK